MLVAWLAYSITLSLLFLSFCDRTAPSPNPEASVDNMNSLLKSGLTSTGSWVRAFLRSVKALSCLGSYEKFFASFLSVRQMSADRLANFRINLL